MPGNTLVLDPTLRKGPDFLQDLLQGVGNAITENARGMAERRLFAKFSPKPKGPTKRPKLRMRHIQNGMMTHSERQLALNGQTESSETPIPLSISIARSSGTSSDLFLVSTAKNLTTRKISAGILEKKKQKTKHCANKRNTFETGNHF